MRAGEVLGVPPDWIMAGNGSDDILTIVTRTFVGQGDLLRLPYPSYILYKTLADLQGARSEEIAFQPDWSLGDDFTAATDRLKLAFLANPNSPTGTVLSPDQVLKLAEKLPCPLLVDEAYGDFAETNCIGLVKEKPAHHGFANAEQVVRACRPALWVHRCATANHRRTTQGQRQLQLRRALDRRRDGRHRRPGLARRKPQADHRHTYTPDDGLARDGLQRDRFASQLCLVQSPPARSKTIYEQLKQRQVLIRYMNYTRWSDGIRISVGSDDQIDALFTLLKEII